MTRMWKSDEEGSIEAERGFFGLSPDGFHLLFSGCNCLLTLLIELLLLLVLDILLQLPPQEFFLRVTSSEPVHCHVDPAVRLDMASHSAQITLLVLHILEEGA